MPTPTRRIFRFAWSVVSWIVFSGLVTGVVAALYYYQRAEAELRHVVEARITEIYPNLSIRVRSARIINGEGIRLGQVSIVQDRNDRSEMVYVESLTLRCDASLSALIQRKVVVRHIVCDGLRLNAVRDVDGRWNLEDLIPDKPIATDPESLPKITLEGANCRFRDLRDPPERALNIEGVNLRIRLKRINQGTVAQIGRAKLPDVLLAFDGSFRTPFCQRIDLEGVARTTDGAWTLQGEVAGASWAPGMIQNVPTFLAGHMHKATGLRARANIQFQFGRKSRAMPLTYKVTGRVSDAHWQNSRWNHPISNISCSFLIDPSGCHVSSLIASFGAARIGGEFHVHGHELSQPYEVELTLDRFPLTQAFVATLPEQLQRTWRKFQAEGQLSGSLRLQFDGQQHQYQSELKVAELSLLHHKFPYRITNCQGDFDISNERCQFDLVGSAGGTPINLKGTIQQPGPRFTGSWEAKTTQWKSIDDRLVAALPPKVADLIRRMQLRGNVGFWVRYQRSDPDLRPPPDVTVALDQAWIKYDRFPYPINNIQGRLEARDGRWSFTQFQGWNDSCRILCDGYWDTRDSSKPLELNFQLSNVGLDDELKHALRPAAQEIWNQLRPHGRLEHIQVRFFKTLELASPELDIQIVHGGAQSSHGTTDSLQLQPGWLPLRMSNVQGQARLRGTSLVLRGLSGEHGKLRFRTNGTGQILPDGRWTINLSNLSVDRLELTESVLRALPAKLTRTIVPLGLAGTFSLAGAMRFEREDRAAPVASSWDLKVNVEQGRIGGPLPTTGIFGQVEVNGASRGPQCWSRGELALDSLVSHGVQLTAVEGPFWLDATRMVFGQRVPPQTADEPSRAMTATILGGRASGNAEVSLNPERDFSVQLNVTSANLSRLGRDWQLGKGHLSGRAFFELFLTGSNRGRHTLRGHGTAQLRDANLYELPLILALLNRMGSGRSDNTAFTTSDVAFHVRDGYVYFDRFDLAGDAITLKGIGEMSLERQLSLDFYSIVGREQLWNPIIRPFLGEASRRFLQIHVDGPLNNPRTTQTMLPGLNETLQQLFPELNGGEAANRNADDRGRISRRP